MGKKPQNPKLKPRGQEPKTMLSVFNQHADRVTAAKRKKIEKVGDTKQRVIEAKKANKMMKISKRNSRFALLDEGDDNGRGLTHKGKKITEMDEFNDMYFGSDGEEEGAEFQQLAHEAHFSGFEEEEAKKEVEGRPKSKAEIYKEIIQKSKLHRHLRSQIYEQNFQKATELDNNFLDLAPKLQFRNRDSKVRDILKHGDKQFDKLAGELRDDEMVMSNKVMESGQKYTEKVKKKKAEQLQNLMEESSEEQDVRGWAHEALSGSEEEEEEDQIDDVQLSSGDEDEEDEQQMEDGEQELQVEEQSQEEQSSSPMPVPIKTKKPRHSRRK